jgi:hypothetical protein
MPDEYLPPNPTLFIQDLPDGTQKADLEEVFSRFVLTPFPSSPPVDFYRVVAGRTSWVCRVDRPSPCSLAHLFV